MCKSCTTLCILLLLTFLPYGLVYGADFPCLDSSLDLHIALSIAASSTADDTITIVPGTYYGPFAYESSNGGAITVKGGFVKVGSACVPSRSASPGSLTILDGKGNGTVLEISNNNLGGDVTVSRLSIKNGFGDSLKGAGVHLYSDASGQPGRVELTDSIIEDNIGRGAVLMNRSTTGDSNLVLFTENIVRNNNSYGSNGGGALAASISDTGKPGTIGIIGNTFTNNQGGKGGGISAFSKGPAASAPIFIDDNFFIGNKSLSGGGGGIHIFSETASNDFGKINLTNNIIAENTTTGQGGGVMTTLTSASPTGNITLTHNTITANHSDVSGGGVVLNDEKFFMVYNNIIWGNSDPSGGSDIVILQGKGFAKNNNFKDLVGVWFEESDSINVNPYFLGNGDYHLQSSSPCRDKGSKSVPLPPRDIDGNDRLLFDGPDLGADEITEPYFSWPMFIPTITGGP